MSDSNVSVLDAILTRHSTRAFLDKPVDKSLVESILNVARQSPSGANLQPWHVAVVTGETKKRLTDEIVQAHRSGAQRPDFSYYPEHWFEPYQSRRFQTGIALYRALDIQRQDKQRRQEQWEANYHFFGAPVGFVFFVDRQLGHGCWVDMGMFMQTIMLAAIGNGLATCPLASIGDYPDVVRRVLAQDDNYYVLGGLALGYADENHAVNQYRTTRIDTTGFTRWFD